MGYWWYPDAWLQWRGGGSSLISWQERDQAVPGLVLTAADEYWGWGGGCPHSNTLFCPEEALQLSLFSLGQNCTASFQGALPGTCFWSQVVTKFICVSDPGSHPEELVTARKPETLEAAQPAAENQEMLCGQSSSTSSSSSLRQSSEQSPTLEQTLASEVHAGLLPAGKAEQGPLRMKDISPEGSCGQQDIQKAKPEEAPRLRDAVRKKP